MSTTLKVREVLRLLRRDGWFIHRQRGASHRQLQHPKPEMPGVILTPAPYEASSAPPGSPGPLLPRGRRKKKE